MSRKSLEIKDQSFTDSNKTCTGFLYNHRNNIHEFSKMNESKQFEADPESSIKQNNNDILAAHYDKQSELAQDVSKEVPNIVTSHHSSTGQASHHITGNQTQPSTVSDQQHNNLPQPTSQENEYIEKPINQHS